MSTKNLLILTAAWIVLALSQSLATAEESSIRTAQAMRTEERPTIDGELEDLWNRAEALTGFIQAEPVEGQPASERTEVRILYDDQAIYIGVMCYDSDPSQIIVTDSRRDSNLTETDSFRVILDTFHDRQNGFVFGTNPAGIEYDGQVSNEGQAGGAGQNLSQAQSGSGFNLNWDTSWEIGTHINELGWVAEFAIPLRSLRYGGRPQLWGLNFQRNIRRHREEVYWSPVSRIYDLYRLSSAGDLQGLDLDTPRNFKVTPYALSSAARDYPTGDEMDVDGDWGVDAKFGVTPSLNLDLTYNTDFAQVEADSQQINLTRFNLFFPEKRAFFLENAGNFAMGKGRAVELFFSRRIGIGYLGAPVPIIGGARLSGKAGSYNIGMLNMQTEGVADVTAGNNFTVASLSRELPNRSNLGVLFTNRIGTGARAGPNNWNRTWGVQGRLGVGDYTTFDGFAARTETPGAKGRERSLRLRGEYRRLAGWGFLDYTEVGNAFNPEVGFLLRDNYRGIDSGVYWNKRFPDVSWFRELLPHATYEGFWDFNGFKESEKLHVHVNFDFENGALFAPAVDRIVEGLLEPFEIFPGIVVPPGNYTNTQLAWNWHTNRAATLYYSGGWVNGGFLSGHRNRLTNSVSFRHGSQLNTSLSWTYTNIDLLEGSFVTNLGRFRFNYSFTPSVNLQSFIQYNTAADIWSSNIRFSWLNTAGTGLFIVYNDTEGLHDTLMGPQNRTFIVKYTHQFDILK